METNIIELKRFLLDRLEAEAKKAVESAESAPAQCLVTETDYRRFFTPETAKEAK